MSQLFGSLPNRVVESSKQMFSNYKDPIKRRFMNESSVDKTRLVNEEVDELDGGHPDQQYTDSNIYSYEPGAGTVYRNKILKTMDMVPCCRCAKRWQLAILANIGFIVVFGIRCNFGAARSRMIKNYTDPWGHNFTKEFSWTDTELGVMEGSFFYGYLITQLPGGFFAAKFAPNKLFGLAIGLASILNMLMPGACRAGVGTVVVVQCLQGLVQGVSYPAMHGVWRYWAPPLERSKLATTAFTGSYAGAVIGLPLSAMLVSSYSWSAPFYVYGCFGITWSVFWYALTFEKPAHHPTITEDEKRYIESQIGHTSHLPPKLSNIPWKAILTSKPVYAIVVANFARSWTFYLLLNHQLAYMRDVLGLRIDESGFLAALPHAVMAVMVLAGGQLADYLRSTNKLSTTSVRKIFNCGGFGGEAVFLLMVCYAKTATVAMTGLVLAVGFSGFAISGFNVNHLDIAPRYASLLMGMSNGVGTLSGMICPVVTEKLKSKYGLQGWQTVFLLASLIHFTGVVFYAIFASGELQSWAEPPAEEETWRPDDFIAKASQAGMMSSYGATERVTIPALPTEDQLTKGRRPSNHLTNGPPPQNSDQYQPLSGTTDSGHNYYEGYY